MQPGKSATVLPAAPLATTGGSASSNEPTGICSRSGLSAKAGKLRLIAVSSDKRQPGIQAPTLKEEGIDVELFNWRGVFAPPGVNDAQRQAMIALIEKMAASPQWAEACKTREWTQITLLGNDYKAFLDAETARIEGILKELGLA